MFTAGLRHRSERAAHELRTGREVWCGDDDVVNPATHARLSLRDAELPPSGP